MIRRLLVALAAMSIAIPALARRPLVFLHGWNSEGTIWNDMEKLLKNNMGYSDGDMHAFSYYNDYFGYSKSTPIQTVAEGVAREIAEIHAESGGEPVDIVAHSMGGLVVRAMLAYDLIDPKCIGRFVSIAVPHYGQNVDNDLGGHQAAQMKYGSLFLWNLADAWHFRGKTVPETLCIAGIDQHANGSQWDGLVHCWSAALGDEPVRYVLKCHSPSVSTAAKSNTAGGAVLGGILGGLPGLIIGALVGHGTASDSRVIYKCSDGKNDDVYVLVAGFLDLHSPQLHPQSSLNSLNGYDSALATATSQGGIFFQVVDSRNVPAEYKPSDACLVHTYWHVENDKRIVADFLEHGNDDRESQHKGVELVYGTMPVGTYDLTAHPSATTPAFTARGIRVEGGRMAVVRLRQDGRVLGAVRRVRFDANGGVEVQEREFYSGCALGDLPSTTRDQFSFKGWWTERTGGSWVSASMTVSDDLALYAHWEPLPNARFPVGVTVAGKGTVSGAGVKKFKSKVTLSATPGKEHVFAGWYEGEALKSQNRKYSFTMPAEAVNLAAKFMTKAEDEAGIGLEFCGKGFGAIAETGGQPVLPVMTNVCGVVTTWPIAASGLTAVKVSVKGQPRGMSYNASSGSVTGVPSVANKSGTMTITVKSAGASRSWAVRWRTVPLPAFACGTFNGWAYGEDGAGRKVTASVTNAGRISAKVGSAAFSCTGWTIDESSGAYVANIRRVRKSGAGKSRKTCTDVLSLTLDPYAAWTQNQLSGVVMTFDGNVPLEQALEASEGGVAVASPVECMGVFARRNPFGDVAAAKEVARELAALGTLELTDDEGFAWNVKVTPGGVAKISRVTYSGASRKTLTGTSVVDVAEGGYGYMATVRFLMDGRIVEISW